MKKSFLQDHLDVKASILECRLDQPDIDTPGMMYVEFGYVEGPTLSLKNTRRYPNLQSRYMTNMHELGHFAHGHTQGRPPMQNKTRYFTNGVLKSEAEAWEWALDDSVLTSYDDATKSFMWERCMGSYYRGSQMDGYTRRDNRLWNGDRGYVPFQWDIPDDYFWSIKERMTSGTTSRRKVPV